MYEMSPAPAAWVLTEEIQVTVTSSFAGDGGHADDHLELRVERPGTIDAYLLRTNSEGEISIDGSSYADLGDDAPAYWGIFDAVEEKANEGDGKWVVPPVGFSMRISDR